MSDAGREPHPPPSRRAADFDETPINPAEVESAGRSCAVVVILLVVLLLVLCVGLGWRYSVLH